MNNLLFGLEDSLGYSIQANSCAPESQNSAPGLHYRLGATRQGLAPRLPVESSKERQKVLTTALAILCPFAQHAQGAVRTKTDARAAGKRTATATAAVSNSSLEDSPS